MLSRMVGTNLQCIDYLNYSGLQANYSYGDVPDGQPFYGGTYYPPTPRHGLPAFRQVLESITSAYTQRKSVVAQTAAELMERLNAQAQLQLKRADLNRLILDDAVVAFEQSFDRVHGGFGGAPKFPQPMNLEFMLRAYHRTRYPGALASTATCRQWL